MPPRSRFGLPSHLFPTAYSLQPAACRSHGERRAFTLVELLITISIIAIMASMVLFALYRAQETAKAHKTRALIAKLDAVIKDKWQTYQYRRVPVNLGPDTYNDINGNNQWDAGTDQLLTDWNGDGDYTTASGTAVPADPRSAAKIRLESIHDLMRWELPDRYSDIRTVSPSGNIDTTPAGYTVFQSPTPSPALTAPSLWSTYDRRIVATATIEHQSAEMLYLIVQQSLGSDDDSRDVFKPGNIGDTDNDGMPEFVDGWGRPIKFIRWAPGMISDLQIVARAVVASVNGNTVVANGPGLSSASGAYIGGAMAVIEPSPPSPNANVSPKPIDAKRMARITGYSAGTFTVAGAPNPFNGSPPTAGATVVIMAPDPFDPTDAQRQFAAWYYPPDEYIPSFAIYPLIYSAGPDGQFGIVAETDTASSPPYSYQANDANPYVSHALDGAGNPLRMMFGTARKLTVNGSEERDSAALDNIHNHLQGLR